MKIRTMIAEDEPPIMKTIKNLIETLNPSFEVIACANDGEEALMLFETEKLDVIFTDIKMPIIGGIELLTRIKASNHNVLSVIISGYQDFEYVRKALQLEVFDYLTKPISVNEITQLLSKIEAEIHSKKGEMEKEYIRKLLYNDGLVSGYYHGSMTYSSYQLILLCAGAFPIYSMDYLIPAREFWDKHRLDSLVLGFDRNDDFYWVIDGKTHAEKIIITATNNYSTDKSNNTVNGIVDKLKCSRLPITAVVSQSFSDIKEIGKIAQVIRSILNKKIIIGQSQIIFETLNNDFMKPTQAEVPFLESYLENLLSAFVQQSNYKAFLSEVKKLFVKWENSSYPQIWVEKLLKHLILICQHSECSNPEYDPYNIELEINETITNCCSYDNLLSSLEYIFDSFFAKKNPEIKSKDSATYIMTSVDEFITTRFADPISNQILSEKFHLAPSYLSKLFRDYKGMTPSEYLIHIRVEKSKELMDANADILAKDVASIVGYSDPLYFSRVFKKTTGIWPSEYRNQNRKEEWLANHCPDSAHQY